MTRARGRCDRGERLRSKAPFGHWKTQDFRRRTALRRPDRAVGHRRADRPEHLRDRRSAPNSSPRCKRATSRPSWTICPPQKPGRRTSHPRARRLAAVSAALQPRPQSDRNGLRQTQGASARHGHAHHRRTLQGHRANLPSLHPRGVCKLLPSRRIRIQMSVRCSRTGGTPQGVATAFGVQTGPKALQRAGCITMTPRINAVNYGAAPQLQPDDRANKKGGPKAAPSLRRACATGILNTTAGDGALPYSAPRAKRKMSGAGASPSREKSMDSIRSLRRATRALAAPTPARSSCA